MAQERMNDFYAGQNREPKIIIPFSVRRERLSNGQIENMPELMPSINHNQELESNRGSEDNQDKPSPRILKKGGFEPFLTDPQPEDRFVNLYGGNFAQQMEFNRHQAEQFIEVAALEGSIVLTSMPRSRMRNIDVNPDGSVVVKKSLTLGESPKEEEEEKPVRVVPIAEGWKIEICDQLIMDELMQDESQRSVSQRFVSEINRQLRGALYRIIVKEKVYGRNNQIKQLSSALIPIIGITMVSFDGFQSTDAVHIAAISSIAYGVGNLANQFKDNPRGRSLVQLYEYLMPWVEIDRVFRGLLYANQKGRNLVRLAKED